MGKLNNIDHSLLNDILNNKLAGYSEDELKTPEERAEKREAFKLENDAKKVELGKLSKNDTLKKGPDKAKPTKPTKSTTQRTPDDFTTQEAAVKVKEAN